MFVSDELYTHEKVVRILTLLTIYPSLKTFRIKFETHKRQNRQIMLISLASEDTIEHFQNRVLQLSTT